MKKTEKKIKAVEELIIKKINEPNYIARIGTTENDLEELKNSIVQIGLIEPIIVKKVKDKYEIIAGHRRFLAHKSLGKEKINAVVVDVNAKEAEIMKLEENIKRKDLNDIEEAYYFEHLIKIGFKSRKELAKKIGRSEAYISQKIEILKYPEKLFHALEQKKISFSAARELIRIKDKDVMNDYIEHAVENGITPAIAKQWADNWISLDNYNRGNKGTQKINTSDISTGKLKLACYVCNNHFFVEQTQMIRICNEDLELINRAQKLNVGKE